MPTLSTVFNQAHLNPYLNVHRRRLFQEIRTDKGGKERKGYRYKTMLIPYDKLKTLP